jgi:hypothetical protein
MPNDNPFSNENMSSSRGRNFDFFREAFDPNVEQFARDKMASTQIPGQVRNTRAWEEFLTAPPPRDNPYDLNVGNQARNGYVDALDRLHNGTSVVPVQAAAAMGQLQGQVMQGAAGSGGLSQALAAGIGAQGAATLAGQAGNARLNEFMNQQQQYGAGLNQLRGQDLSQMGAFQGAGLKQRGADDALANFYADSSTRLSQANKDLDLNNYKLRRRLELAKSGKNMDTADQVIGAVTTAAKAGGL